MKSARRPGTLFLSVLNIESWMILTEAGEHTGPDKWKKIITIFSTFHSGIFLSQNVRECPSMSEDIQECPRMSGNVRECPRMSENVRECPRMSEIVRECPSMAENAWECPRMSENVWECPRMSKNVWECPRMSRNVPISFFQFFYLFKPSVQGCSCCLFTLYYKRRATLEFWNYHYSLAWCSSLIVLLKDSLRIEKERERSKK